jgi:hypothetical protein
MAEPLNRRDLEFLRRAIAGETMTYLGHRATHGLKTATENAHCDYLLALNDKLDAEISALPSGKSARRSIHPTTAHGG